MCFSAHLENHSNVGNVKLGTFERSIVSHLLHVVSYRWCGVVLQELDSDFSEENRRHCADAAQPLIEAIDELTTFASSPEFTSVPAKISLKVSSLW